MKTCNKCERQLPKNTDYFYKKKDTPDGFMNKCKECNNGKFTKYLELKDGEMFCKNCSKILPYTDEYFPKDKTTKTGLRNVCYECKGQKYGKRQEKAEFWSKEEDDLLRQYYPNNLNSDIIHLFPNRTIKALCDHASLLGIEKSAIAKEEQYRRQSEFQKENCIWLGVKRTEEEKERQSILMKQRWNNNREEMLKNVQYERTPEIRQRLSETVKAKGLWAGENNPRHINPLFGEDNGRWQGGITPLLFWLRNQLDEWKQESMKFHKYTCILTGYNFDEIHHLTSFKKIVGETLKSLGYDKVKNLEEFSSDELEDLRKEIVDKNNSYGLGVCLTKEVHKLFHDTYSYGENTPENFYEFCEDFRNGKYNHLFEELGIKIKSQRDKEVV